MPFFTKLSDFIALICKTVIVVSMIAMITFLFIQVLLRYLFATGLPWAEELAVTLCAWMVLLSAGLGVKEGFHVRLTVLIDRLPPRWMSVVERLIQFICLVFGVALACAGYWLSEQSSGMDSATLAIPVWILYTVTALSGAVIAFFSLENLILGPSPVQYAEDGNV